MVSAVHDSRKDNRDEWAIGRIVLVQDQDGEPLTLMLKAFRGTHLAFELGSDLAEELIEPVTPVTRGDRPYPTMASVQRHNSFGR
jgi:hypothetical protein